MTRPPPSRGRSVLVAILGILACLAITISATAIWVHQVALNTDRYVELVSRVAADPEVIDELSTNLAERLTDRIVDRVELPSFVGPLLESWIQEQIASFMRSEAFADGWEAANRVAHTALVRVLRSEAVLGEEPVTISVSQLLVLGFQRLQEAGVIPEDVQLPDLSDREAVDVVRRILAERLNIEVPEDVGQITLVRSERLEAARQLVRIFDILTVISVILAVALVTLTIWLARNRLRAVFLLGIGATLSLLAAIGSTSLIGGMVVNALAEAGATNTIGALVNALLGNLATTLVVVVVVGALTTLAIVLIGRQPSPAEAMAVASPYPAPWAPLPVDGGSPPPPSTEPPAKPRARPAPRTRAKPAGAAPAKTSAKPAPKRARGTKGSPPSS